VDFLLAPVLSSYSQPAVREEKEVYAVKLAVKPVYSLGHVKLRQRWLKLLM